jgi:hypothetical protein
MPDEEQAQGQGAPSQPPMVAPVAAADPEPAAKPKRVRNRRGGRPKLSEAERAERQAQREQDEKMRAAAQANALEARRSVARLASIGALTPGLLTDEEISGVSRFALAMLQQAPQSPAEGKQQ